MACQTVGATALLIAMATTCRAFSEPARTTLRLSLPKKLHVVAYGENRFNGEDGAWTIHAEEQAVKNLRQLPRQKRLEKINLLVIRTSKTGVLGQSKPCIHCIVMLCIRLPEKGYTLDRIYYTDGPSNIAERKLINLLADEHPHTSMYYRSRLQKIKLRF